MRAIRGPGVVRLGVAGWRSAAYSTMASNEKTTTAAADPIKTNEESPSSNQPR
jgi:hypothetical protein